MPKKILVTENQFKSLMNDFINEQTMMVSPTASIEKQVAKQQVGTTKVLNPNASLVFNGDSLIWMANGTPVKQWKAVSGLTILNAKPNQWGNLIKRLTTQPEVWSKDKSMGPTPPGLYVLGSLEDRKGNKDSINPIKAVWLSIKDGISGKWNEKTQDFGADTAYSRISWGNFRAPVIPTKGTETFGRGGFYLHGGTLPGSHGCIDLAGEMEDFAKFYGTWLGSTKKKSISLSINYGTKNEVVKEVWKATSNVPITPPQQTNTQPISEPIQKPVMRPLTQPKGITSQPITNKTLTTILKFGSRGPEVTNMQNKLISMKYNVGPTGADGIFGTNTQDALMRFQTYYGIPPTGMLDQTTKYKLMGTPKVQQSAVNQFM